VTVAQRPPSPELYPGVPPERLVPGSAVFRAPSGPVDLADPGQWWSYVEEACWHHPHGPGGVAATAEGRAGHPVVHIAFDDALAYAAWAGKRLPAEAEWEYAARGGLDGAEYCWGDSRLVGGRVPANVWAGEFPWRNDKAHPPGTEPVGSYGPNGYGLHDMAGNVWEWTVDDYRPGHEPVCCLPPADPVTSPGAAALAVKVIKGGSYLCADNYCARYRPAARIPQPVDTSTGHLGFRCVTSDP
jgi:sulfatase modifying factor 1